MSLETRQHREAFATLGTGEGALGAAVAQSVALEAGGVSEALPALGAHEGLLPCVDAEVLAQVAQVVEVAAAVAALEAAFHLPLSRSPLAEADEPPAVPRRPLAYGVAAAAVAAAAFGLGGGATGAQVQRRGCFVVVQL